MPCISLPTQARAGDRGQLPEGPEQDRCVSARCRCLHVWLSSAAGGAGCAGIYSQILSRGSDPKRAERNKAALGDRYVTTSVQPNAEQLSQAWLVLLHAFAAVAVCSACTAQIGAYLESGDIKIHASKIYPFAQAKCVSQGLMRVHTLHDGDCDCVIQGGLRGAGHVACQGKAAGGGCLRVAAAAFCSLDAIMMRSQRYTSSNPCELGKGGSNQSQNLDTGIQEMNACTSPADALALRRQEGQLLQRRMQPATPSAAAVQIRATHGCRMHPIPR